MIGFTDEIQVRNQEVFGDTETHNLTMMFYNGYAISDDNQYGLSYPTLEEVRKTIWMQDAICDYCGNDRDGTKDPFDIALKFGVLFKLPQDNAKEQKLKWLEQFALTNPDGKNAYEKLCNELAQPDKDYFAVYHDRTGDGGMKVRYLGTCCCDDCAVEVAFATNIIPKDVVHYFRQEDIEAANNAIDYGEDMEVVAVYRTNNNLLEEYWTVVSSPALNNKFAAFVWNRNDRSEHVSNRFYTFTSHSEMQTFILREKVNEMREELPEFNVSWFLEKLDVNTGLHKDATFNDINIWAQEGYNVWICCGTYK